MAEPTEQDPQPEDLSPLGQAALDYAAAGYAVFPLAPGTKRPLIAKADGGKGCLDATTDPAQIRGWWSKTSDANIGIACGAISRITVVDVDVKPWKDKRGDVTLAELQRTNGKLPATLTQTTWSGGFQLVFDHVPGVRNSAGNLGEGLDVRNDGGYVVAPPSFVEEDGRSGTYEWVDVAVLPTAMPAWLVAKLKWKRPPGAEAPPAADAPINEGTRDVTLHAMARSMRTRGVPQDGVLAALLVTNEQRCVPPYTDLEVADIVRRAFREADEPGYRGPRPATEEKDLGGERFTDRENARLFEDLSLGDVRHADEIGEKWLQVGPLRWSMDFKQAVVPYVQRVVQYYFMLRDQERAADAAKATQQVTTNEEGVTP